MKKETLEVWRLAIAEFEKVHPKWSWDELSQIEMAAWASHMRLEREEKNSFQNAMRNVGSQGFAGGLQVYRG